MTTAHDPLCPFHVLSQKPTGIAMSSCQCGLIARVREDERATALRDAVEAVKALHEPWILDEPREDGVTVLCAYCQSDFDAPYPCESVAAIEALGGES